MQSNFKSYRSQILSLWRTFLIFIFHKRLLISSSCPHLYSSCLPLSFDSLIPYHSKFPYSPEPVVSPHPSVKILIKNRSKRFCCLPKNPPQLFSFNYEPVLWINGNENWSTSCCRICSYGLIQ